MVDLGQKTSYSKIPIYVARKGGFILGCIMNMKHVWAESESWSMGMYRSRFWSVANEINSSSTCWGRRNWGIGWPFDLG